MIQSFKRLLPSILPFIIVFFASFYQPSDPDLGWYLGYGKYFDTHHTLLTTNTFSQMMPNYHWTNHSWLTDIITYEIMKFSGFFGLAIFGSLIVVFTFFFFSKAAKLSLWQQTLIFPILLFFQDSVNSSSFRAQSLTYLFLGIQFYLLRKYEDSQKKLILFFLPAIFLFWVNIHGGYSLGLVTYIIWSIVYIGEKIVRKKYDNTHNQLYTDLLFFTFLLLSIFLGTLINPFGLNIYKEIGNHVFQKWQPYIAEWQPFLFSSRIFWNHIIMGILILMGFVSLFFTNKLTLKLPYLVITTIFFLTSFMARRYAWPLYYISLPLIAPIASILMPPSKKAQSSTIWVILLSTSILVGILKYPFSQYGAMDWNSYCAIRGCSDKAVEYVLTHKLTEKIYTVYDWGGWIIWRHPKLKPTIDGRMVLWRYENGYSAFGEYYPIEQNWKDIDKTAYTTALVTKNKPVFDRLNTLVREGRWDLVYQDDFSGVFVKKPLINIKP